MDKPSFVYVTYIATTPEKVWDALMDGEMTKLFWGRSRNVSSWKVGSRWEHQDYDNPKTVDVVGKVVEATPPRRLVLTWASPAEAGDESGHARVIFDIEPFFDAVRLTVTHENPASEASAQGWPAILSSLKTLLETGKPMTMTTRRWGGPPRQG